MNNFIYKSNINTELVKNESGLNTLEYVLKQSELLEKRGYKNRIRRFADRKNYNAKVVNGYIFIENIGFTSWDSFTHLFMRNLDCEFIHSID